MRRSRVRTELRRLWRLSWIPVIPFLGLFGVLAIGAGERYLNLAVDQLGDRYLGGLRLVDIGRLEATHLWRRAKLDFTGAFAGLPPDDLPQVRLFVSEAHLNKLASDLPRSGFEYVDAGLTDAGNLRKVRLRYRGDFHMHWGFYKKSMRIKTKKKRFYRGMRRFNLIKPKTAFQYSNHVGYNLATEFGLIAPRHDLVRVFVNGDAEGLYLLAEQQDESTLRHLGYMPGDLYSGDQVFGRNKVSGVFPAIFEHPGLWEKLAYNNHYPESHRAPIEALLRALAESGTPAGSARLIELIDLDAFVRMNLLEVLLGSYHYDTQHNWRLYYDPWRKRFMPVIWDPLAWLPVWRPGADQDAWFAPDEPPPYVIASPLTQALHRNAVYLARRAAVFEDYLAGEGPDRLLESLPRLRARLKPVVAKDPAMLSEDLRLISSEEAYQAMLETERIAAQMVDTLRNYYVRDAGGARMWRGDDEVTLSLRNHRATRGLRITLAGPIENPGESPNDSRNEGARLSSSKTPRVVLAYEDAQGLKEIDVSRLASPDLLGAHSVLLDLALTSDLHWGHAPRAFGDLARLHPAIYRLRVPGADIVGVDVRYGGKWVPARIEAGAAPVQRFAFMHQIATLPRSPKPVRLAGRITFAESRVFDQPVVIEGGAHLLLGADVSLTFRRRLVIEGADRARVTIEGADTSPWGALVLEGPGAGGSVMTGVDIRGGSGFRRDLDEATAMLSVHGVPGVRLTDCSMSDNARVDDMLHVVYGSIEIDNCDFNGAKFDAVDLDMTVAQISRSRFIGSGNDGLDLMGSAVTVDGAVFRDNGDKGISVGERSDLLLTDSTLNGNVVGVQAKDDSVAVIRSTRFGENGVDLDAYRKNWRYETGGSIWGCGQNAALTSRADKSSAVEMQARPCGVLDSGADLSDDRVSKIIVDARVRLRSR